jgi:hypothetical protein
MSLSVLYCLTRSDNRCLKGASIIGQDKQK